MQERKTTSSTPQACRVSGIKSASVEKISRKSARISSVRDVVFRSMLATDDESPHYLRLLAGPVYHQLTGKHSESFQIVFRMGENRQSAMKIKNASILLTKGNYIVDWSRV
jgi:hypothetical protein